MRSPHQTTPAAHRPSWIRDTATPCDRYIQHLTGYQDGIDRLVAVKVLQPEKVADPGRKHRFIQEAKSVSALNHPNIIHVYDVNQSDGTDFIVMEHVAGKTLDELIPRKGMRLSQVLKYALQIADALTRPVSYIVT